MIGWSLLDPEVRLIDVADDRPLIGDRIFVLDIADFRAASLEDKAREAATWLRRQVPQSPTSATLEQPSVVAITPRLLLPATVNAIAEAGAICQPYPAGYSEGHTRERKLKVLSEWLSGGEEPPSVPRDPGADPSIYETPPYQLAQEDFERLLERIRTSSEHSRRDD